MEKTIDIFIKTWIKDFRILKYCLMSIKKNLIGYNKIIILIPEQDYTLFINFFSGFEFPPAMEFHKVKEYGNGYLFQQWCKLSAHKYSNADFILFSDSDCIYHTPINLQDYIKDSKPTIQYTDYSKVGDAICWKEPTEKFMQESVQFEFMRKNFLIYHRSTLKNISFYEPYLEKMIMEAESFSEFNAMGAFAFKYENEKYNFVNTDEQVLENPLMQLWSWANKNDPSETHQYEYARSLEIINKVLDLQLTEL